MFELGRKPSQVVLGVFFLSKIAKIAKDKCTHRWTNAFDASISTIARVTSLCGYTPYGCACRIYQTQGRRDPSLTDFNWSRFQIFIWPVLEVALVGVVCEHVTGGGCLPTEGASVFTNLSLDSERLRKPFRSPTLNTVFSTNSLMATISEVEGCLICGEGCRIVHMLGSGEICII